MSAFDMRTGLKPERVINAMWDFSWLYGHYPGGPSQTLIKLRTSCWKDVSTPSESTVLDTVLYVDLDQEFPFFSPVNKEVQSLGSTKKPASTSEGGMEQAGKREASRRLRFNYEQMNFLSEHFFNLGLAQRLVRGVHAAGSGLRSVGSYSVELLPSLLEYLDGCGLVQRGKRHLFKEVTDCYCLVRIITDYFCHITPGSIWQISKEPVRAMAPASSPFIAVIRF